MGGYHSSCLMEDQPTDHNDNIIEFDGERFILPHSINFNGQSTFSKVQHAARAFCQKNGITSYYVPMLSRLIAYRHESIFDTIWPTLDEEGQQNFMEELSTVDHDLMDSFYHNFIRSQSAKPPTFKLHEPRMTKLEEITAPEKKELIEIGNTLIQTNKVAVLFMCGGSSSSFDQETDKFLYPFDSDKVITIFDLLLLRLKRNCKGKTDPAIIIGCSEANMERIYNQLKKNGYYGFNSDKVRVFKSSQLPIFDSCGNYCFDQKLKLIKRSQGTALCAEYLFGMNTVHNFLQFERIEYVHFVGMENLMENPLDPLFLGMAVAEKRDIAAKCVRSNYYCEHLPRYYRPDENSPTSFLNHRNTYERGEEANFLPIAMNSMVFNLKFLRESLQDFSHNLSLAANYEVISKNEAIFDPQTKHQQMAKCYSFEKDLRLLVNTTDNVLFYHVPRAEFVPIYTKRRQYSIAEAYRHYQEDIERDLYSFRRLF